MLHATEIRL